MPPVCKCGKTTINTDCHCNDCKDRILDKALDEEKQNTVTLCTS
ncbi:unnamed protein product, partial [marine sediment metagenome]